MTTIFFLFFLVLFSCNLHSESRHIANKTLVSRLLTSSSNTITPPLGSPESLIGSHSYVSLPKPNNNHSNKKPILQSPAIHISVGVGLLFLFTMIISATIFLICRMKKKRRRSSTRSMSFDADDIAGTTNRGGDSHESSTTVTWTIRENEAYYDSTQLPSSPDLHPMPSLSRQQQEPNIELVSSNMVDEDVSTSSDSSPSFSPVYWPHAGSKIATKRKCLFTNPHGSLNKKVRNHAMGSTSSRWNENELIMSKTWNSISEETAQPSAQPMRKLDSKKHEAIAKMLRLHKISKEEIQFVLREGDLHSIGIDPIKCLLKFAPSEEEADYLKECCKDNSQLKLDPVEKFLKAMLDIPLAFKRMELLVFTADFNTLIKDLRQSFETIQAACDDLKRNNESILMVLNNVFYAGRQVGIIRRNYSESQHTCHLDTLLKLANKKGVNRMVFALEEAVKNIGDRRLTINSRKAGLQIVSNLSYKLVNVKKAAAIDSTMLTRRVSQLGEGIDQSKWSESSNQKFPEPIRRCLQMAREEIITIQAQWSDVQTLVNETIKNFNVNSIREEPQQFRIFTMVSDIFEILDDFCKNRNKSSL